MRYMYKLVCLIYFLTYMFTYVWKCTYMLTYMNFLYVTYMSVPYGLAPAYLSFWCSISANNLKMHCFELWAEDRLTDGSHNCLMPPMGEGMINAIWH